MAANATELLVRLVRSRLNRAIKVDVRRRGKLAAELTAFNLRSGMSLMVVISREWGLKYPAKACVS